MKAPDADIRQQALDVTQSYVVQAPAGSGKTELLIQRYLALLATVEEPEEVLAITFTRKAVAEMRHRVLQALQQSALDQPASEHAAQTWGLAKAVMQRSGERGWHLAMQPARLRILTIDSLNALLVRRMPWLSGIGMDATLESQPAYLYEEAAWDILKRRDADPAVAASIETLLLHQDNQDRRVAGMLSTLLARRDQWLRYLIPLRQADQPGGSRQLLTGMFESALEEELSQLANLAEADTLDELVRLSSAAARVLMNEGQTSARHLVCGQLDTTPGFDFSSIPYWKAIACLYLTDKGTWRTPRAMNVRLGFAPGSEEKQAYTELYDLIEENEPLRQLFIQIRDYPDAIYSDAQWQVLEALIELLPVVVAQLQLVFRRHAAIDFVEQSLAARRALGQGDEVTELDLKLDYQLRHILMDEFQDTSHSQFALLERLVEGWQEGDGRTLFLVGDPMQSIYLFREADVSGFLSVRDHGIGAIRPRPLVLQTNFRSTSVLVDWFNTVFPDVLAGRDDISLGAVRYVPATSIKTPSGDSGVTTSLVAGRSADEEAQEIANTVQALQQAHPEDSIGILVRSRRHLYTLIPTLEEAEIDFNAVDIQPLLQQPAIQDLISITRTLLHRHDRVAWLAILRAPWCGLTLDSMHRLTAAEPERDVWSLLNDPGVSLEAVEAHRLQRVLQAYRDVYQQRQNIVLSTQVEWLWYRLGADACHAGSRDDVTLFLNQLALLEKQHGHVTARQIQTHFQDMFSSHSNARARVQLMTIHKSKGLEFDSVIIPALDRGIRPDTRDLMIWHEERGKDYQGRLLLAPVPAPATQDNSFAYVRRREQQRAFYEHQRLLYVAMTRATKRLYLYAGAKTASDGDVLPPRRGSFLALLGRHISVNRTEVDTGDAAHEKNDEEDTAVIYLKRLPADWQPGCEAENINGSQDAPMFDENPPIEFSWAGQRARLAGKVVHHYLQLMAGQGVEHWSGQQIEAARAPIGAMLVGEGLPADRLSTATDFVIRALSNVLSSRRGQWILADYAQAKNEYAVSGLVDGHVVNRVIDRTFVDEHGIRWIIDYKTSSHQGSGLEAFVDEEQHRYHDQLTQYARLMQHQGEQEIRCGLYFPVMDAWREWGFYG